MTGPDLGVVAFGLGAAAAWGASDFGGGFASRRTSSIIVVLVSQMVGLAVVAAMVAVDGEPLRSPADLAWGAAAGLAGAIALVAFYRALAVGRMGLVAPVAGVLGAALPLVVGSITEGLPSGGRLVGIALAMVAVFLVSRPDEEIDGREGLGLALAAGVGFGSFFVLLHNAGRSAVLWPIIGSRTASSVAMVLFLVAVRRGVRMPLRVFPVVALAGLMDMGGNVLYIVASSSGTLAVAAVLSSLYPVVTVILAWLFLGERVARVHAFGIVVAAVAIALIGAG
jgi:drug/metabolite transporter (DMT)-like permease